MIKKDITKIVESSFFDNLKNKFYESSTEYFKRQFEKTKQEVFSQFEKKIEKKIKREIKKLSMKIISLIILATGLLILLFGIFSGLINLLQLPEFLAPISYGTFLLIIGLLIYLLNK